MFKVVCFEIWEPIAKKLVPFLNCVTSWKLSVIQICEMPQNRDMIQKKDDQKFKLCVGVFDF